MRAFPFQRVMLAAVVAACLAEAYFVRLRPAGSLALPSPTPTPAIAAAPPSLTPEPETPSAAPLTPPTPPTPTAKEPSASPAPPSPSPSASLLPPTASPYTPLTHLTVTFWNVEWFPGRRPDAGAKARETHVAAVQPVITSLAPDVLGLEEVADADAARLLASRLPGGKVDVCSEFVRDDTGAPTHQQTALCSRLPLLASGWQPWQPDAQGRRPRRGFVFAAYQPSQGQVLLVYGLHLKSNVLDEPGGDAANFAMRQESARQLLVHERAEEIACTRWGRVRLVIVGGDMNTSLDDPRFRSETTLRSLETTGHLRWAWDGVPLPLRLTLPASGPYPSTCFDHIFYRGEGTKFLGASLEPTGSAASDHRPVTARFDW